MVRAVRGVLGRVFELFISGWPLTLAVLVVLSIAWLLSRQTPAPPIGFAIAGALAALVGLDAAIAGRHIGGTRSKSPSAPR